MSDAQPSPATRPPRASKGWGSLALLVVVIVAVTGGGWVVSAIVPGDPGGVSADAPGRVEVGPTLEIPIEPGWYIVRQNPSGGGVVLSNGIGALDAYPATSGYTDPAELVRDYVAEILRPAASQLSMGEPVPVAVRHAGDAVVRVPYQGTFPAVEYPLEGAVTAVIAASGNAVVFDGRAPQGQLPVVLEDVDRMIAGSTIR